MPEHASVSVIIPTYNYGHYLGRATESVLNQTAPPLEIIVVDDGSTDDTPARVAVYGDRVRYIRQPNQGIGAARNTGIRAARGDWVALLDSDDDWHPRKLEFQQRAIAQRPDVALVATGSYLIDEPNSDAGQGPTTAPTDDNTEVTLPLLLQSAVFCPSSAIIRADCLATVGLFDEDIQGVEDLAMWWRIASRYPMIRLSSPLTGYRDHPQSISKDYPRMLDNLRRAVAHSFATIPALRDSPKLRRLARARIHTEAAWMYYAMDNHWDALLQVGRSVIAHPTALRDFAGQKYRWRRARLALRFCTPLHPAA